jgi:1-deoxy-D-xylulose-5-phosphate synthase
VSLSDKKYIKDAYPLLGKIDSPSDLRKLRLSELPTVCAELRKFMIEALSENPGHFASSMGAVELTVALHYALNTPYDRVVWDVGHQAYSHKILTGRRDEFYTNRKLNGLSGFPNPDESDCDSFIAGHASNSISAGMGMAVAQRIVDLHNGTLLSRTGEQGGVTFTVALPTGPLSGGLSLETPSFELDGGVSPFLLELSDLLPMELFEPEPN